MGGGGFTQPLLGREEEEEVDIGLALLAARSPVVEAEEARLAHALAPFGRRLCGGLSSTSKASGAFFVAGAGAGGGLPFLTLKNQKKIDFFLKKLTKKRLKQQQQQRQQQQSAAAQKRFSKLLFSFFLSLSLASYN